jgi:hypothetical protein
MGTAQSNHTPYTSTGTVPNKGRMIREFGIHSVRDRVTRVVDLHQPKSEPPPKELVVATLKVGIRSLREKDEDEDEDEDLHVWVDVIAGHLLELLKNKLRPQGKYFQRDTEVTEMVVRVYDQYVKHL